MVVYVALTAYRRLYMLSDELINCFKDTFQISIYTRVSYNTNYSIKSNKVYMEGFVSTQKRKEEHAVINI